MLVHGRRSTHEHVRVKLLIGSPVACIRRLKPSGMQLGVRKPRSLTESSFFRRTFKLAELIMIRMHTLTAVIHRDDDMYVAECPEVGTASQGKSIEEAAKNLKEATELYLEEFPLKSKERSFITTFEVTEVAET